jgi:CDP-paratose 2-epimerase
VSPWEPDGPYARRRLAGPLPLEQKIGLCQWFHFRDHRLLEATLETLPRLGIRHLRTGLSWADYHRPGGREWYDDQMSALVESNLEILLSVWHTPPSISMDPSVGSASVPPEHPRDFADFLDVVIDRWGDAFQCVELWNEPNNPYKWRRRFDRDYRRFAEMVINAGHWARYRGKKAVLGGMALLDQAFLHRMDELGVLDHVDVVGAHAFPGMWEPYATDWEYPSHWHGWAHRVDAVSRAARDLPVWITEAGTASRRKNDGSCCEDEQAKRLLEALQAPTDRLYWYSLFDLDPARLAIEESQGGPREEPEYHMGLVRFNEEYRVDGYRKEAFHELRDALAADRSAGSRVELGPGVVEEPSSARTSSDQ